MKNILLFTIATFLCSYALLAQTTQETKRVEIFSKNKSDLTIIPHGNKLLVTYTEEKVRDEASKPITQLHLSLYDDNLNEVKKETINLPNKYHLLSHVTAGQRIWFLCAKVTNFKIFNTLNELHLISYHTKTGEITKTNKVFTNVFAFEQMDLLGNEIILSGTSGKLIPTMGSFTPSFVLFNTQSLTFNELTYRKEELRKSKSQIVTTFADTADNTLYIFHRYKQQEEEVAIAEILKLKNNEITKYATLTVPKDLELYDGKMSKIDDLLYIYGSYGAYSKFHEKPMVFSKGAFIGALENGKEVFQKFYSFNDLGVNFSLKVNHKPIELKAKHDPITGGKSEPCFVQFHPPIEMDDQIRFIGEIAIPYIPSNESLLLGFDGYRVPGIMVLDISVNGDLLDKLVKTPMYPLDYTENEKSTSTDSKSFHAPYSFVWQKELAYCPISNDKGLFLFNAEINGVYYYKYNLDSESGSGVKCVSNDADFNIMEFDYFRFHQNVDNDYCFFYRITPWNNHSLIYSGAQYLENKNPKAKNYGKSVFFIQKISAN